jgi:hypothetical protein
MDLSSQSANYQFVTAPNGDVYIFQPKTGSLSRVTKDCLIPIGNSITVLKVGQDCQLEDKIVEITHWRYLGNGRFEPSKSTPNKVLYFDKQGNLKPAHPNASPTLPSGWSIKQ